MRRSKGGRPSKAGARTASGQLSRAGKKKTGPVQPNERTAAIRAAFDWFKSGKAGHEAFDPIGRAWLVGLLDDQGIAPEKLRDAARGYVDDYWSYYGRTGLAMADLEPEARGVGARKPGPDEFIPDDPQGEWLAETDKLLIRAGRDVRDALHNAVVDHFFFPDENPAWLDRLITGRRVAMRAELVKIGRLPDTWAPIAGALPIAADHQRLACLLRALRILVTGSIAMPAPRVAAEPAPAAAIEPLTPVDPAFLDEGGFMRPSADIADIIRERHAAGQPEGD